jgi:diphosphomevalonate decarboxylase
MRATAIAHPNIALVKYWGKRDDAANLPAVGSLSITVSALRSRTTVEFQPGLRGDTVVIHGREDEEAARRARPCLDALRRHAGIQHGARVETENDFPTGAGLASSASGFAALTVAGAAALGLELGESELVDAARLGSGSAPRSLFGGFALLRNRNAGIVCERLLGPAEWPLTVIFALTAEVPKAVSSRDGMALSRTSSPYYGEWVRTHEADLLAATEAVQGRDLLTLGELAEHNCLKMHAVMLTSRPPLLYWTPATLACIQTVRELRGRGVPVFFTIDAGPQVKAVCLPRDGPEVKAALAATPGVVRIIESGLGDGARVVDA